MGLAAVHGRGNMKGMRGETCEEKGNSMGGEEESIVAYRRGEGEESTRMRG